MSTKEDVLYPEQSNNESDKEIVEDAPKETQEADAAGGSGDEEVKEVEAVKDEAKKEEDAGEKKEVEVPEKYDLKLPDNSLLQAESIEAISQYAKEKGLSNAQAQELLERENSAVTSFAKTQQDLFVEQVESWKSAASKDPEIGGDKFNENVELAKRALETYGSPEFSKQLNETGFGNHPELIRMFAKVGRSIHDDNLLGGDASKNNKKSFADRFYGDQKTT